MAQLPNPADKERQSASQWPDFIEHGFEMIYGEYIPDEEVEAFAKRWGGLNLENFVRAIKEGQREDRLLAICVIGWSDYPQASSLLRPFLQSTDAKERWLSALCLGRVKEAIAFPILISMLTEYLPSEQSPTLREDQGWFDEERIRVAFTLGLWEDPSLVPALRHAYASNVNAEQYIPNLPAKPILKQSWYLYQETLMRLLGRWGAFGVLAGMILPPFHLKLAIVNIALGFCQVERRYEEFGAVYKWQDDATLNEELKLVMRQRFGLSEEEQNDYLEAAKKGYIFQWRQLDQDK